MVSLSQSESAVVVKPKSIDTEIREGDWDAYQLRGSQCGSKEFMSRHDNLTTYRQQCALAYLGKRAQLHGGICSKMQARILTPLFIAELATANKNRRFGRYPWLERLVDLIAEIEREQDDASISNNVISLIAAMK